MPSVRRVPVHLRVWLPPLFSEHGGPGPVPPTTSRPSKLDLCLGQRDPTWSKALFKGWLARRGGLFTALQGVALCLPFCFPVDRGGFYLAFKNFKKCCLFICLSYLQLRCLQCCAWALSGCGERGLLSSCGARASYCGGFSCCRGSRADGLQ